MSGQETRDNGVEVNRRGKRRLGKKESDEAKENTVWGQTVTISGFNHETPADSSWGCASDALHAVD